MNKTVIALLILILSSCSGAKIVSVATGGKITQPKFNKEIAFRYVKKHIFIDVSINGKVYNFLFDTGVEVSNIDKSLRSEIDFRSVLKIKTTGSSFEDHKTQYGFLSSLEIEGISFENIGIGIEDLTFVNKDYVCEGKVDGIIGNNIMRKAFWQIDYVNKRIRFTDDLSNFKIKDDAHTLTMTPRNASGWGNNSIKVKLDKEDVDFVFDTGSSGSFTTTNTFAKKLYKGQYLPIRKGNELKNQATYENYLANIRTLKVGEIELQDMVISMEREVSFLLGNQFLEQFELTIDWQNNRLYLSSDKDYVSKTREGFEFQFQPNFTTNKIEISGQYIMDENIDIKIGTEVLALNDQDVSNMNTDELCAFWKTDWPQLALGKQLKVEFQGLDEPVILPKRTLNLP